MMSGRDRCPVVLGIANRRPIGVHQGRRREMDCK